MDSKTKTNDCEHDWIVNKLGDYIMLTCKKCGDERIELRIQEFVGRIENE